MFGACGCRAFLQPPNLRCSPQMSLRLPLRANTFAPSRNIIHMVFAQLQPIWWPCVRCSAGTTQDGNIFPGPNKELSFPVSNLVEKKSTFSRPYIAVCVMFTVMRTETTAFLHGRGNMFGHKLSLSPPPVPVPFPLFLISKFLRRLYPRGSPWVLREVVGEP